MATWKKDEVCPLIGNAIHDVHDVTNAPVPSARIVEAMLSDRLARRFIDAAADQQKIKPESVSAKMVAWFSAAYTQAIQNSGHAFQEYVSRFERTGTVGAYAYSPRAGAE